MTVEPINVIGVKVLTVEEGRWKYGKREGKEKSCGGGLEFEGIGRN